MDVADLSGEFDTAVQNPPFGVWRRGADLLFLRSAARVSRVIYSIHKAGNRGFLEREMKALGFRLTDWWRSPLRIKRLFDFHRREERAVEVELLRFEVMEG